MVSRQSVEPPPAQPPRYSLLIAAEVVDAAPSAGGAEWAEGVTWVPENCGTSSGGRHEVVCNTNTAREPGAHPAAVAADPFVVWAADRCSTLGANERDFAARARRQLAATRSYEVAEEVWGGSLGLAQRSLADLASDVVTTAPSSIVTALAHVEYALGQCYRGRRGMVHMSLQALVHAIQLQALVPSGAQWLTASGHLVVADAGYDGSGPDGDPPGESQWLYGTSWMRFRMGDVQVLPSTASDLADMADAVDRSVNDVAVYAQQLAMWEWDECCHIAAELNLPAPAIGGVS